MEEVEGEAPHVTLVDPDEIFERAEIAAPSGPHQTRIRLVHDALHGPSHSDLILPLHVMETPGGPRRFAAAAMLGGVAYLGNLTAATAA